MSPLLAPLTVRAVAVLGAAVLAATAAWWVRGTMANADLAQMALVHAQQVEEWSTAAARAANDEIERLNRRLAEQEAARDQAIALTNTARADAARFSADAARVRADIGKVYRYALSRDPTLADGSPAGTSTTAMLTHMLSRALDRAEFLAAFADRARIAGLTCERAYDGLRAP